MVYRLLLKPRAKRDLDKLPAEAWSRVHAAIMGLAADPRPDRCRKLRGGAYRIRVIRYRVIYDVDDGSRTVTILRAGHRRDVCRRLT